MRGRFLFVRASSRPGWCLAVVRLYMALFFEAALFVRLL